MVEEAEVEGNITRTNTAGEVETVVEVVAAERDIQVAILVHELPTEEDPFQTCNEHCNGLMENPMERIMILTHLSTTDGSIPTLSLLCLSNERSRIHLLLPHAVVWSLMLSKPAFLQLCIPTRSDL